MVVNIMICGKTLDGSYDLIGDTLIVNETTDLIGPTLIESDIKLYNQTTKKYIILSATNVTSNYPLNFPAIQGLANTILSTDGAGNSVWAVPSSIGIGSVTSVALTMPSIFSVAGTNLTTNASFVVTTAATPTGTGGIVLQTSPALITPDIGGARGTSLQWTGGSASYISGSGTGNSDFLIAAGGNSFVFDHLGATSLPGTLKVLSLTASSVVVSDSSKNLVSVTGTNGQVLTLTAGAPVWQTPSSPGTGTVTSVALTMPSIFSVAGTNLTTNASFVVTTVDPPTGTGGIVLQTDPFLTNVTIIGGIDSTASVGSLQVIGGITSTRGFFITGDRDVTGKTTAAANELAQPLFFATSTTLLEGCSTLYIPAFPAPGVNVTSDPVTSYSLQLGAAMLVEDVGVSVFAGAVTFAGAIEFAGEVNISGSLSFFPGKIITDLTVLGTVFANGMTRLLGTLLISAPDPLVGLLSLSSGFRTTITSADSTSISSTGGPISITTYDSASPIVGSISLQAAYQLPITAVRGNIVLTTDPPLGGSIIIDSYTNVPITTVTGHIALTTEDIALGYIHLTAANTVDITATLGDITIGALDPDPLKGSVLISGQSGIGIQAITTVLVLKTLDSIRGTLSILSAKNTILTSVFGTEITGSPVSIISIDGATSATGSILIRAANTLNMYSILGNVAISAVDPDPLQGKINITSFNSMNLLTTDPARGTISIRSGLSTSLLSTVDTSITAGGALSLTTGAGALDITTGSGAMTLTVGGGAFLVTTGGGALDLTTGAGAMTLTTGTGALDLTTGGGAMTLTVGGGAFLITTGAGALDLTTGAGAMTLTTGTGALDITTGGGAMTLTVGGGAFLITTGAGALDLTTGAGVMTLTTGTGALDITTGGGAMTLTVGGGAFLITTGAGTLDLTTGAGAMTLTTGAGGMLMTSGLGSIDMTTGVGDMTLTVGGGAFLITTGTGTLDLTTGAGAMTLTTGIGIMAITTGGGSMFITTGGGFMTLTCGAGLLSLLTLGGGIFMHAIAGGIEISTTVGGVKVTCASGDSELSSAIGACYIYAPVGGINIGDSSHKNGHFKVYCTNGATGPGTGNCEFYTSSSGSNTGPGDFIVDTSSAFTGNIQLTAKGDIFFNCNQSITFKNIRIINDGSSYGYTLPSSTGNSGSILVSGGPTSFIQNGGQQTWVSPGSLGQVLTTNETTVTATGSSSFVFATAISVPGGITTFPVGTSILIAGFTPSSYNGTFTVVSGNSTDIRITLAYVTASVFGTVSTFYPVWQTPSSPGTGTVTSVALTMPSLFSVAGTNLTTNAAFVVTTAATPTGTGGIVLLNTPTLVTPVLGAARGTSLQWTGGSASFCSGSGTGNVDFLVAAGGNSFVFDHLGATSLPGTLKVSSLTASYAVATDSSNNLVSVQNTGTGLNVLQTSPTMSAPTFTGIVNVTSLIGTYIVAADPSGNLTPAPTIGTGAVLLGASATANLQVLTWVTGAPVWQAPATSGTVTSVALTMPSIFSVAGTNLTTNAAFVVTTVDPPTGTGGIVLLNTPTLVTPIIGAARGTSLQWTGGSASFCSGSGTGNVDFLIAAGGNSFVFDHLGATSLPGTLKVSSLTASSVVVSDSSKNLVSVTGTNGQVLTLVSGAPVWQTPSAPGTGTVTSVALTMPSIFSVAGTNLTTNAAFVVTTAATPTGTGGLVLLNTPTLVTPVLGVSSATSITFSSTATLAARTISGNANYGFIFCSSALANASVLFCDNTASTMYLKINGSSMLQVFGSVAATSLNLSGLTASYAVATDSSNNLVSVQNTGTGLNVLQTSPALITPDIGSARGTSLQWTGGSASYCSGSGTGNVDFVVAAGGNTFLFDHLGATTLPGTITVGGKTNSIIPTCAGSYYDVTGTTTVLNNADTDVGLWTGVFGVGTYDLTYASGTGAFTNSTGRTVIVTVSYTEKITMNAIGVVRISIYKQGAQIAMQEVSASANSVTLNVSCTLALTNGQSLFLGAYQSSGVTQATDGSGKVTFAMSQI